MAEVLISKYVIASVIPDGRIDVTAAPAFDRLLTTARESKPGGVVIADLSEVTYLSSAGARAMVKALEN